MKRVQTQDADHNLRPKTQHQSTKIYRQIYVYIHMSALQEFDQKQEPLKNHTSFSGPRDLGIYI